MEDKEFNCEALMRLALAGDKRAYAAVLEYTALRLRAFLASKLSHKEEIEDIIQETLISIHKARHTYDGGRPYMPWVYAIAKFRLQDHLRRFYSDRIRHASDLSVVENTSVPDVTESTLSYETISEEIERLPGKAPVILKLLHHDGYTAKEVAEKTGMKESAVKVAAHRAYKVLRAKLERP